MRKILIFIAFGLSGLAALASVQPVSAKACKQVCDRWEVYSGKLRCFSSHPVCTASPVSNSGGGAQQSIQNQKNKHQN